MKSKKADWFEVAVRYLGQDGNGLFKTVTEQYVTEGATYAEVEERIVKEITGFGGTNISIKSIRQASFAEFVCTEDEVDEKLFKAKVLLVALDENSGKEKRTGIVYLVRAADIDVARNYIKRLYSDSMADYELVQLVETPFVEVFQNEQ